MRTGAEHGGAFWNSIGADFKHLKRRSSIINADVLDAWFPPSPLVLEALGEPSAWLFQTSPPEGAEGLLSAISGARRVSSENIVLGAGSSDLIFRALLMALDVDSRALVPDPTYGEYAHVLDKVIGCRVDRLPLIDWRIDLDAAAERLNSELYELFVLVNPNSPTGHSHSPGAVAAFIKAAPERTMIWIDEAYADYAGISCEPLVAEAPNVIVCKSMSKVYSLSGLRVGYLVGPKPFVDRVWLRTPPWIVSLPGQIAACAALADSAYYAGRYDETRVLRGELETALVDIAGTVLMGETNFVLWRLPADLDANAVAEKCERGGVYVRKAGSIGSGLENTLRISVKGHDIQERMLDTLRQATFVEGLNP